MHVHHLRLTASSLDFWVDVRLASFNGRWLAVADICGEAEIGLGTTRSGALSAALAVLGLQAAKALQDSLF